MAYAIHDSLKACPSGTTSAEVLMPILVLVIAAVAGFLLARRIAFIVTAVGWAAGVLMVGFGPAGDGTQETGSLVFWGPWLIILVLALAVTWLVGALRSRARAKATETA
jgi:hypothetical protein